MALQVERVWSAFQLAIFRNVAEGKGHTVVLARAGSGKTSTIIEGLSYVPEGMTVLVVAFNKIIADELVPRVPRGVDVATLHSFGLRAISRRYGRPEIEKSKVRGIFRTLLDASVPFDVRASLEKAVSLAKGAMLTTAEQVDDLLDAYGLDVDEEHVTRTRFCALVVECLGICRDPFRVPTEVFDEVGLPCGLRLERQETPMIDFDDMVWLPV